MNPTGGIIMKQRIGVVLCLAGCILLINPQFNLEGFIYFVQQYAISYWPIILVLIGYGMLVHNKPKKSHR